MLRTLLVVLGLFGFSWNALAQSPYGIHAPLPDSISWVVYKGEAYQQFLVRADDPPQPQWGDGVGGQLRKRAQLIPMYRDPLGSDKDIEFHFLVPDDWKISTQPVLIAAGHSVNLKAGPWALHIIEDKLQFTLSIDNPKGRRPDVADNIYDVVRVRAPLMIDHLYGFRLQEHVAKDMTGYARVFLDGTQIVNYFGPTVSAREEGIPYEEFGTYVFSPNLNWPFPGEDHKRVLMRIP